MSTAPAALPPTPLADELAGRIARTGPISVAAYMEACLHDPVHGYYRRRNAIGRAGDFITAPEISQAFGELVGLWCAVTWQLMGEPSRIRIVELGPGRGTLMHDALRAVRALPAFRNAIEVQLVETNSVLEALQRATLDNEQVPIRWCSDMDACADGVPAIVVANEFLDTLAITQWVMRDAKWFERCVGIDDGGRLAFVERAPAADFVAPPAIGQRAHDGDVFESRSPAFAALAAKLAAVTPLVAALFVDYGHLAPTLGDTLQAVRAHRYDDPLSAPGEADLTAQVDFAAFTAEVCGRGLVCDGPMTQAEFLGALGIAERASHLMAANPGKAIAIETAIARLMAPGGMGTRFQAVGVRSARLAPLPGFATVDNRAGAP